MGDKNDIEKFNRPNTKLNLEPFGELELKSISGNDSKFIFGLLKEELDEKEFTIFTLQSISKT